MKYTMLGDSDCPLVEVNLGNQEAIMIERGSMVYSSDVQLVGKLNSSSKGIGGFFSAIGRSLVSGESMFITRAISNSDHGVIGIAPAIPGKINCLKVEGDTQYRLNTGAFLACDESVNYEVKSQNLGQAAFGGTGGIFVIETSGQGDVLINSFGDILKLEVSDEKPLVIDNNHVVAWDKNLDYSIEIASGTFGFTTGEGLVNRFTGNGSVYIQTRNLESLALAIGVYLPNKSGR